MLTQLVGLLENKENGLSLAEISRAMNVQPSALMGMIELLVRKRKLIEIGPDGQCCAECGLERQCNLLAARGKRYIVNSLNTENRTGVTEACLAGTV
ncbi:MAG: FeoC-like transcriptional regulator [Chloroflexota bacterium]